MESTIDKVGLQKALNKSDQILESVSFIRKDRFDNACLVIYLVPSELTLAGATQVTAGDFILDVLTDYNLSAGAPACLKTSLNPPARAVLVNAIPRDETGAVDEAKLNALPVVDADLIADWSKYLGSHQDIESVAVISALRHRKTAYLHRDDVFQSIDYSPSRTDISPHQNSVDDSPNIEASARKVSSVLAEVSARGQLFRDRLDDKYCLCLANTLYRAAEISPDKGILYIDKAGKHSFQTYPQLLQAAQTVLAGLQARGIAAGDKVLLQCVDNREFLAVFWACILGALVPVPVSVAPSYSKENAVVQKLLNVWRLFERPIIVCSDSLESDFRNLYEDTDLCEQQVLYFRQLLAADSAAVVKQATEVAPDALALLLLTSGSTGTPKAVMHTHQTLINRSAATSSFNQFDREDVSLNWMPLDHVGGIVMFHLRDVYNACSQIQVATSWILEHPLRWLDTIDSERASITWAPNFAFALIVDQAEEILQQSWDLTCMRFVLNGGEAVVARTATRFLELLEKDQLRPDSINPAWGMSETASGVCYSHNFTIDTRADSDGAVEVGAPIPNTSLRIVDAENRVLYEGEKGNLQIRGASVTPGYYLNPEENQRAFTADGWFNTGDVGSLNNGRLTITARVKDEIIINGVNYPAAEIETGTETVPGVVVSFTAACAVRRAAGDTDSLAIFFCPYDNDTELVSKLLKVIQETVSSSLGVRPEYIIPLSRSQIPKTNIGKIQRSMLKQRFEQGEFDEAIRISDLMLGTNVVPDWFYEKTWFAKALLAARPQVTVNKQRYLVFADSTGFSAACCQKLSSAGAEVVTVSVAADFECLDENTYTIDPNVAAHYAQLFRKLQKLNFSPDVVLHCWTYAEVVEFSQLDEFKRAHQTGIYSLLHIVQSLADGNSSERSARLIVVSCDVQQCLRDDNFINPHATILGLLKTAPRELDWLSTRHIDFCLYQTQAELTEQVDTLCDELVSESHDSEVVYRGGLRYGWRLAPATFTRESFASCPIRPGGIILITGGLGGVGSILARFLIKNFNARLLLTGRTVLPEREKWPALIRQGGKISELLSHYLEIEALKGEFVYSNSDVSDPEALQSVVGDAEQHWNEQLNGVFHLAVGGDIGTHSIIEESVSAYDRMFATKIYGTLGLANLVAQRDNSFMVSFGSVIAEFGDANYSAYAAAHTFLNQLTAYYNQQLPGRYFQFDWAAWENNPAFAIEYFRTRGYSQISAKVGMECLMAGLCHRRSNLMIGLDATNWLIRKHLAFESQPLLKLVSCFTVKEQKSDLESSLRAFSLPDRFQVPSRCEYLKMEKLPKAADGNFDIPALQVLVEGDVTATDALPATELEKRIAEYWSEVLDVNEPGRHANFFQLGGNSLSGMQLISRLNQSFSINLEMRDLFTAFNISDMAALIENRQTQTEEQQVAKMPDQLESLSASELLENLDQMSEKQIATLLAQMQLEAER